MAKTSPFDTQLPAYESWFIKHEAVFLSELAAIRQVLPEKAKGVEIGTGSGIFAESLGIKEGVEPSAAMRQKALERNIQALDAVAENLPYSDAGYDFALMVTTLCFVDDPARVLSEVCRILKPGGALILAYVDKDSPLGIQYLQNKEQSLFYREATFFTTEEIFSLLAAQGFIVEQCRQTIFGEMKDITEPQQPRRGFGQGSFVVIKAVKPCVKRVKSTMLDLAEQRLNRALEAGNMAWWEMELPSGRINFSYNKTRLLGLNGDDFEHFRDFMNIVHPEDCDAAMNAMYEHLHGKAELYECEYRMKNAGGKYQWFHDAGKIVQRENEKIVVAGIVTEITAKKQAEKQLLEARKQAESANDQKNQFLANMSHEIRTPINAMLGFASLLREEGLETDTRHLYLDIIESSSKQLLNLINDIMDISKIEVGQLKIKKVTCPLNKILLETETLFNQLKQLRGRTNLKIEAELPHPAEDLFIVTDPERLKQILINLIGNSLKFTEEGGIRFGYKLENNKLNFYVEDSGAGMSKEDQKNIFERFKQADNQSKAKYEGSGLGLAITKALVNLLGGSIAVDSEPGKGSLFTFDLPYEPGQAEASPTESELAEASKLKASQTEISPSEVGPARKSLSEAGPEKIIPENQSKIEGKKQPGGKSIIIAEDVKINRLLLGQMIKELNLTTYWAENGLEAVELFRKHSDISLILMDVQMPVMDGEEAARQILALSPGTLIIAQTAHAMAGDKESFLSKGFVDYISKPIDKQHLIATIRKWIE